MSDIKSKEISWNQSVLLYYVVLQYEKSWKLSLEKISWKHVLHFRLVVIKTLISRIFYAKYCTFFQKKPYMYFIMYNTNNTSMKMSIHMKSSKNDWKYKFISQNLIKIWMIYESLLGN